jgi:hypothetical protein
MNPTYISIKKASPASSKSASPKSSMKANATTTKKKRKKKTGRKNVIVSPTANKANKQDVHKKVPTQVNDTKSVSSSSTYSSSKIVRKRKKGTQLSLERNYREVQ